MTTTNTPSIYIHRAHSGCVDPDVFRDTFNRVLGADCVRSVDLVKKTDQNQIPFIRAFVHFKFWPRNETADRMHYELITDKRIEVIYNQNTRWFWRVCRSKLPARDDPNNATPRTKNRKPRHGNNNVNVHVPTEETIDSGYGDVPACQPVLKRSCATGVRYIETSKRKVTNKPAWMSEDGCQLNCNEKSVTDSIPETMSLSDDGECE